jgi:hypothetical protein
VTGLLPAIITDRRISMKSRQISALVVVAAGASLTLSACAGSRTVHSQRSFSLAGSRLVIDVGSSDLRLVPASGSRIQVQRWLGGTAAQPGHSSWNLTGDTLRLTIDCTGLVLHCGSRFQVALPPDLSVVVHSDAGADTVSGTSDAVVIDGGSGQVNLSDTSGSLQVSTDSGNIIATAIRSQNVHARANSGNVGIVFAAAPLQVDIGSSEGNATATVPVAGHSYHVIVRSSNGNATSKVPNDSQSSNIVRVSASNGNAKVLPAK